MMQSFRIVERFWRHFCDLWAYLRMAIYAEMASMMHQNNIDKCG